MHRTDAEGHLNNMFTDGGPGIPATVVDAAMMNALQEELCNVIEDSGYSLYGSGASDNWDQLVPALKYWGRRKTIHATSGSSTAYTITTSPAITSYINGMSFYIKPHTSSGSSPTLNVDGQGAISIYWCTGETIKADELFSGGVYEVIYNSSAFYLMTPSAHEIKMARYNYPTLADRLDTVIQEGKGVGPGTGDGYLDEFASDAIPQMWDTGWGVSPGGYGYTSAVKFATGQWDYTLDRTYQSTAYAVLCTFESDDHTWTYQVSGKTTSTFRINFFHGGTLADPTIRVNILVMGKVVA